MTAQALTVRQEVALRLLPIMLRRCGDLETAIPAAIEAADLFLQECKE